MFEKNQTITLHYPRSTIIGSSLEFTPRRLIVRFVRDLVAQPLTVEDYLRRPTIRRGRLLVAVKCLETGKLKYVYPTSSREHFREVPLRIGLYEPCGSKPREILSRAFHATVRDRLLLARALLRWRTTDFDGLSLRVFCDDLNVTNRSA